MRAVLAFLCLARCAGPQIPSEQQAAYFNCSGIIVDTASENLQRAGYITDWREGDRAIETKWISYSIAKGEDRRTLFLRYVVQASNDGVNFAIYERTDDARGEAPWDRITEPQMKDPATVELLEKIRRDVCGEGFFARTSTAR